MADTTAVSTGKKSGVNKRLEGYFESNIGQQIHSLECLFHTNEIYFTYAKNFLEGKAKGPNAYEDGALINEIKRISQPRPEDMKTRQECEVSATSIASNHLKTKIVWFSDHKDEMKLSFHCDHMCLLALAAYLLMDAPENLQRLLFYCQETISHARWLTTASGYLRMFIFGYCVEPAQISRLQRMVSFIVCVYLPAFLAIHLKSSAAEGPSVVLFTRNLLLAYKEVDLIASFRGDLEAFHSACIAMVEP